MRPLSHSSINLYLECPQKWKLKYVDRLPEKPRSFFSFGRSVHSALEMFYSVPAPPAPSIDDLLAHYKREWVSEGYKDDVEEAEYFAEGERILRGFHARHAPDFVLPFFAEYRFDLKVEGVSVTGYVDRIDKAGKDRIAIIDYKTGKSFGEERVRTDAQLTMYQMACEELLGMKVESLTFYHLNSLKPVQVAPHSAGQVKDLRSRIVSVAGSIQKGLFDPLPEERKCSWCDFKPHCPVFRDHYAPQASLPLGAAARTQAPAGPARAAKRKRAVSPERGEAGTPSPASAASAVPAAAPDAELAELIDRYGRMLEEAASLQARADDLAERIAAALREKGWVRAFGAAYEASLETERKWEFKDKPKVLDLIRRSGLWEDILAPSAPLVQKLMRDPSVSSDLRDRLRALGSEIERSAVTARKTGA